ncbi:MAG: kelch repeat-containing protein [Bacteroides intestinalis]
MSVWEVANAGATSFVIDNIAYVCTGYNNGEYVKDFWKYDPTQQRWIRLRDIADTSDDSYDNKYNSIVRIYGVSFVIDGQAYLRHAVEPLIYVLIHGDIPQPLICGKKLKNLKVLHAQQQLLFRVEAKVLL